MGASVGLAAKRAGVDSVAGYDSDDAALAVALERGAVDEAGARSATCSRRPTSPSSRRRSRSAARRSRTCSRASGERLHGDGRRLDEGLVEAAPGSRGSSAATRSAAARLAGPSTRPPTLFDGATWFLTPVPDTDPDRYRLVHGFVASLGATPVAIDPVAHDRLVGARRATCRTRWRTCSSTRPAAARIEGHDPLAAAGGSLRDMTRVAGANPRIWVDIFLDNAPELAEALAEHRRGSSGSRRALDGRRRRLPGALDRRGRRQPPADARRRLRRPGRAPAGDRPRARPARACWPGSPRRSAPSGSTSRTSSSGTSRPSAAASLTMLVSGEAQAERAAALLEAQGYGVVVSPVIED